MRRPSRYCLPNSAIGDDAGHFRGNDQASGRMQPYAPFVSN
jgi:hypothetical protein